MITVIKIGTNLLTAKDGTLDKNRLKSLAKDIAEIIKSGKHVVIVTSGAIGSGMGRMKIAQRPKGLHEKQALAAIGQPLLMHAYIETFSKLGIPVGQILITRNDFEDAQRCANAKNTVHTLLNLGVLPVINENDTTTVEEINANFGDNDTLSALVAVKISANLLIILTDVDGLYCGTVGKSDVIKCVKGITNKIERLASNKSGSGKGVGGMATKISAAKIATKAGIKVVIANGFKSNIIRRIKNNENIGTSFLPKK
jgi:glutamate 5-kinase